MVEDVKMEYSRPGSPDPGFAVSGRKEIGKMTDA
jgi:hypothetical protein